MAPHGRNSSGQHQSASTAHRTAALRGTNSGLMSLQVPAGNPAAVRQGSKNAFAHLFRTKPLMVVITSFIFLVGLVIIVNQCFWGHQHVAHTGGTVPQTDNDIHHPHAAQAGATAHRKNNDMHHPSQLPSPQHSAGIDGQLKTLKFAVCNGFANQRLSIVYGLLIAVLTNRTAVLPNLIQVGLQRSGMPVLETASNSVRFSSVYDADHFTQQLAQKGIKVLDHAHVPAADFYHSISLDEHDNIVQGLNDMFVSTPHVSIGCPLLKLDSEVVARHEDVAWHIFDSLQPSLHFQRTIQAARRRLEQLSSASSFNFLHLRIESDWKEHCSRWTRINDGVVRNNCFNNTLTVDGQLTEKAISPDLPLYVATYWQDAEPSDVELVKQRLQNAGYRLFTSADVLAQLSLKREASAMVEYHLALEADKFIGNSVSTFSALLIMERRHRNKWASYYNGGDIPVAKFMPLDPLPWIFTHNSWSKDYDYMLEGAVNSALQVGHLKPYCMYTGDTSAPIFKWMVSKNITIILHAPAWKKKLLRKARPFMTVNAKNHSPLYASERALVGTFQRVDIPVLPELKQYDYILYTDSDVFFMRRLSLSHFPLPLPGSIAMATEMVDMFPYNAGVMLMNLGELRRTYKAFIKFILRNKFGMYFPNYGPGDQGAYNQFYESTVRGFKLSQVFNAKPYLEPEDEPFIVHFHGPKPHDYAIFLEDGVCKFDEMCQDGFSQALCKYIGRWAPMITMNNRTSAQIQQACDVFTARY